MFVLWEPQVFFTQDKKAEEEAETMASCFPLRTVLFSGFILLVFLSPLKCICTTCNISGKKRRGKIEKREDLESLNPFIYGTGQPSSDSSNPVQNKLPSCEWALGRWAVLLCWSWQSVLKLCSSFGNDHCITEFCEDEHWSKHGSQWHSEHCSMLK